MKDISPLCQFLSIATVEPIIHCHRALHNNFQLWKKILSPIHTRTYSQFVGYFACLLVNPVGGCYLLAFLCEFQLFLEFCFDFVRFVIKLGKRGVSL